MTYLGMSSEAAAYDFKQVTDFSHGTSRIFAKDTSQTDVSGNDEDTPPSSYSYGDFHTIDWVRDIQRDRMRHRQLIKRCNAEINGWKSKAIRYYDSLNAWICVFLGTSLYIGR